VAKNADAQTLQAIQAGDLLLRVDELDATTAPLGRASSTPSGANRARITPSSIERAGATQELTLKVAHLL
jgi:hypothetical protein